MLIERISRYIRENRKVFLFAIAIGGIQPLLTCRICLESFEYYVTVAGFITLIAISMWLGIERISHWLDGHIRWTKAPVMRMVTGLLLTTIYTIIMSVLLKLFVEMVTRMSLGSWQNILYSTVAITLTITFFMTSRSFLLNWRQTSIDAERLKKESIAAQYESLKNQVNPHFLFNSFNVLSNLVYEDQDKAVKFIKQLSEVYRYVLDSRTKEIVDLGEELHFLESYIFLQQIRFGDKLRFDIRLDGVRSDIAPLALQLLVENAIKHNIVSQDDPLTIRLFVDGDFIVVENNLQVKQGLSEHSSGIGLENIAKRYEFLSERKIEVLKTERHFIVKLPVIR